MIRGLKQLAKDWIYKSPFLNALFRVYLAFKYDNSAIRQANDPIVAYKQDIKGVQGLVLVKNKESRQTLPDSLIIQSGSYQVSQKIYNCFLPGVYRFVDPQHQNRQHVILDHSDSVTSALLISFLSIRGNRDDQKTVRKLEQVAVNRFLSLTCGKNCLFGQELLQRNGFRSRIVYSHTYEAITSYNNGHVLLEVYSTEHQKYVLVDLDKKCVFYLDSNPLSLFEYSQSLHLSKPVKIKFLSHAIMMDWSGFIEKASRFHYGFIEHNIYSSEAGLIACLSRICQVPMMIVNEITFICAWDSQVEAKLLEINPFWQVLNPEEFQGRFYST